MHISQNSQKTEVMKFRVTEQQADLIIKNYRAAGFENLSQYLRFLVKQDIDIFLLSHSHDNVISLCDFRNNGKGTNDDTSRT